MRSYLQLFGGLAPLDAQTALRGNNGLFDTWRDYLAALGMPDYTLEIARNPQTNSLMIATFERMGVALCDRAVEKELQADTRRRRRHSERSSLSSRPQRSRRRPIHRALRHPSSDFSRLSGQARQKPIACPLLQDLHRHRGRPRGQGRSQILFTPPLAGWATVCYGLVRHPSSTLTEKGGIS